MTEKDEKPTPQQKDIMSCLYIIIGCWFSAALYYVFSFWLEKIASENIIPKIFRYFSAVVLLLPPIVFLFLIVADRFIKNTQSEIIRSAVSKK